jgi:hypothetical protein
MADRRRPRARYRLDLVDVAAPGDAPPSARLKRLLKGLLRTWGFRCVVAVEVEPAESPSPNAFEDQDHEEAER